jgi:hypothetical protein
MIPGMMAIPTWAYLYGSYGACGVIAFAVAVMIVLHITNYLENDIKNSRNKEIVN